MFSLLFDRPVTKLLTVIGVAVLAPVICPILGVILKPLVKPAANLYLELADEMAAAIEERERLQASTKAKGGTARRPGPTEENCPKAEKGWNRPWKKRRPRPSSWAWRRLSKAAGAGAQHTPPAQASDFPQEQPWPWSRPRPSSFDFPSFRGFCPSQRSRVPADIMAGITLAALNIPQAMGYTRIAGTPVITGLYAILIPTALFAMFGSSRHLVVGADSATAAILAAGLAGLAVSGSPEYVALCGVLAFMAAAMLIIARLIRLGFLADFLSRTVLIGFLTGVGVQVSLQWKLAGMLGLPKGGQGPSATSFTIFSIYSRRTSTPWR